jgi:hypothetical protein
MGDADDIRKLFTDATKKWTKQRKSEERYKGHVRHRYQAMTSPKQIKLRAAAAKVMRDAYLKASANGTLPANARQIMYAARPEIMKLTNGKIWKNDSYFTQHLLPDYIRDNDLSWNVVYDDRGHFIEPHTGIAFGLGTLNVRNYIRGIKEPEFEDAKFVDAVIKLIGPNVNFSALLYVEKEGFMSLFQAVKLAQRYDLAIMSAKGMSVTAARKLAESICSRYGIPLMILHDFDRSGLVIEYTMHHDTRRYQFSQDFHVIDLGFRLEDVEDLEQEGGGESKISDEYLEKAGATPEEIEFLRDSRVELNAMSSDRLIAFIEEKLEEHGIRKIVPKIDLLKQTYRQYAVSHAVKTEFNQSHKAIEAKAEKAVKIPRNLKQQVEEVLEEHDDLPWHHAIRFLIDPSVLQPPSKNGDDGKTKVTRSSEGGLVVRRDGMIWGFPASTDSKSFDNLPKQVRDAVNSFLEAEESKAIAEEQTTNDAQ